MNKYERILLSEEQLQKKAASRRQDNDEVLENIYDILMFSKNTKKEN